MQNHYKFNYSKDTIDIKFLQINYTFCIKKFKFEFTLLNYLQYDHFYKIGHHLQDLFWKIM